MQIYNRSLYIYLLISVIFLVRRIMYFCNEISEKFGTHIYVGDEETPEPSLWNFEKIP